MEIRKNTENHEEVERKLSSMRWEVEEFIKKHSDSPFKVNIDVREVDRYASAISSAEKLIRMVENIGDIEIIEVSVSPHSYSSILLRKHGYRKAFYSYASPSDIKTFSETATLFHRIKQRLVEDINFEDDQNDCGVTEIINASMSTGSAKISIHTDVGVTEKGVLYVSIQHNPRHIVKLTLGVDEYLSGKFSIREYLMEHNYTI